MMDDAISRREALSTIPVVPFAWITVKAGRQDTSREVPMQDVVYTLGVWKVKPGLEAEFIATWKALGEIFVALDHPPGKGTLIQSLSDPALHYSFGPWNRLDDIEAMRSDPRAQAGIRRLVELCTEATPGSFRVVAEA